MKLKWPVSKVTKVKRSVKYYWWFFGNVELKRFFIKRAAEDAYLTIVWQAIKLSQQSECNITVGEDIVLLVPLTAHASDSSISFLKLGKGQSSNAMYPIQLTISFKYSLAVKRNILFLLIHSVVAIKNRLFSDRAK